MRQFNNHKYQSWKVWTLRDKKLTPDPVSRMNIGSYLLHPTHHKVLCNLLSICVRLDDAARLCWQLKYTQVGLVALWGAMLDIFALYQFIYFVAQLCTSFALGYLLGRHSLTLQCCPCQCLCLCTCGNAVTAWAWSRLKLSKALLAHIYVFPPFKVIYCSRLNVRAVLFMFLIWLIKVKVSIGIFLFTLYSYYPTQWYLHNTRLSIHLLAYTKAI